MVRRGHLIVERARNLDSVTDRVWVTSEAPVGAEAALSGGRIDSLITTPETNAAEQGHQPIVPGPTRHESGWLWNDWTYRQVRGWGLPGQLVDPGNLQWEDRYRY